jgi:flagellar basal body-associated protein FliL
MIKKQITEKGKTFRTVLIIGSAVVAVFAVGIIAFMLGSKYKPEVVAATPVVGGRGIVAVPENVEELREKAKKPVEDGYYETRMNVEWDFPSSSEPSTNAYVENSLNNKRTVYFDLTLADTKELIYSSPFIPVGAKLEKFTLDTQLPAGEYAGIVTYHLVDDDYQELTTVSVSVTLNIKK